MPLQYVKALTGQGGHDVINDYLEVPEVNYIINLRARMFSNVDIRLESKATGLEVNNQQSLARILRTPNWYQSQKEFLRQLSVYRDVFGEEIWYFFTPVGMSNNYKGMFNLYPPNITTKYEGRADYFHESEPNIRYFYNLPKGGKIELDRTRILHLTDNNVGTTDLLRGSSKLQSLKPAIDNIRRAYRKRGVVLDMPPAAFAGDTSDATGKIALSKEETNTARNDILQLQGKPIVTPIPMNYFEM